MAESKKAMEQRHAKTLGKIAKEEAQEANEYAKGGAIDGVASKGHTSVEQVKMACGGKAKKYACGGKIKKYEEGGDITEGPNANIDDDTRQRALAWANSGGDSKSGDSAPAPRAKPVVRRAPPTPASKPEASETPTPSTSGKGFRGHMSDATSRAYDTRVPQEEPLEGVYPEQYLVGSGLGAGLKLASRGLRNAIGKTAGENGAKKVGTELAESFTPVTPIPRKPVRDTITGIEGGSGQSAAKRLGDNGKRTIEGSEQSAAKRLGDNGKRTIEGSEQKRLPYNKPASSEQGPSSTPKAGAEKKPISAKAQAREDRLNKAQPMRDKYKDMFAKGGKIQTSFAKGGSVKGWGISKHTNSCKVV